MIRLEEMFIMQVIFIFISIYIKRREFTFVWYSVAYSSGTFDVIVIVEAILRTIV